MGTTLELWDTETGNVVGSFARRQDTLVIVETLLDSFGVEYARDLSLGRRDGAGTLRTVATGDDLIGALTPEASESTRGASVTTP